MISKKQFVSVIESMRKQFEYDISFAQGLSDLFKGEIICYNNSEYIKSLMLLLRLHFPTDESGFCEIEHYCFVLKFGHDGDQYESPEMFYDRLCNEEENRSKIN